MDFETLYGEPQIINGEDCSIVEPKMIKHDGEFYGLEKGVAKRIMTEIGMKSAYFSERLYDTDKETWQNLLEKTLENKGGKIYLEEINLFSVSDQVVANFNKELDYKFIDIVNSILDFSNISYMDVDNFYFNSILEGNGSAVLCVTHPNYDVKMYTGVRDDGERYDRLYLNPEATFREQIKKEGDIEFLTFDFDFLLDNLEEEEMIEMHQENYSVKLSLSELITLLEDVDMLVDDIEDLDEFTKEEREIAREIIDYIDEEFEDYGIAKNMYFVKKATEFTKYTAGDMLEIYTKLLMDNDSDKVKVINLLDLAEKVASNNFHYIQLEKS